MPPDAVIGMVIIGIDKTRCGLLHVLVVVLCNVVAMKFAVRGIVAAVLVLRSRFVNNHNSIVVPIAVSHGLNDTGV